MADEKKVVNLAVDAAPQIDRTPPAQEPVQEVAPSTEPPVVEGPIAPETQITAPPVNADVDEFGVSWKNRAMEWRRKSEEMVEKLPQIIDEKLSKITQPQQQQPQYTYEQLEVYKAQQQQMLASDPNAANAIAWATAEQRKMQQAENKKMFQDIVGQERELSKSEQLRQSSLAYVRNTYPEAFDKNGNWDFNNTLTQQIKTLMQNPKIGNDPEGLSIAADAAYGRVQKYQTPVLQKQVQQTKADLKQAQKASLTEGSGRRVTLSEPPQVTAINTLKKTGSIKDASAAIGEIMRQRGIIGD